ncbi:hypothetical protein BK741_20025 [Bacillus thuringiensis serovar iberica]|uniref:Uncharacterized protein n=1 Tax=Bacillus thuringiensis serovar iberica TaxID=180866 RepID=A0A9X6LHK2_BACTU|nr:hypothetical protein BK741_20025 [Bacillus thuringiensis serovar iberica]PFA88552.1 hypothetical protein CN400_07405 [Bacillus thuringiensis]
MKTNDEVMAEYEAAKKARSKRVRSGQITSRYYEPRSESQRDLKQPIVIHGMASARHLNSN